MAGVIFGLPIIVYSDYKYPVTSLVNISMVNMVILKKYDSEKKSCFPFGVCYDAVNKHGYDVLGSYRLIFYTANGALKVIGLLFLIHRIINSIFILLKFIFVHNCIILRNFFL